jgi:hypothetical protein
VTGSGWPHERYGPAPVPSGHPHGQPDERCEVPIIVTAVEIIDGVEVPIGEPQERTISRGALDLLHGYDTSADEALGDRRQRAREAFDDAWSGANDVFGGKGWAERLLVAREAAIETATRVRVDREVTEAAVAASGYGLDISYDTYRKIITAAFLAAGFEVEQ